MNKTSIYSCVHRDTICGHWWLFHQ